MAFWQHKIRYNTKILQIKLCQISIGLSLRKSINTARNTSFLPFELCVTFQVMIISEVFCRIKLQDYPVNKYGCGGDLLEVIKWQEHNLILPPLSAASSPLCTCATYFVRIALLPCALYVSAAEKTTAKRRFIN